MLAMSRPSFSFSMRCFSMKASAWARSSVLETGFGSAGFGSGGGPRGSLRVEGGDDLGGLVWSQASPAVSPMGVARGWPGGARAL